MSETKKITNVQDAAEAYAHMLYPVTTGAGWDAAKDDFINGAEWQRRSLLNTLKSIAEWPGNLPDDRLTSKTGPNDAALRGSMLVAMRQLAMTEVKKFEPNYNPINQ